MVCWAFISFPSWRIFLPTIRF